MQNGWGRRVAVVATIALAAAGCSQEDGSKAIVEEKFKVRKVDLRDVIVQTGEVQPVVKVELKSEASGRIQRIVVKEGQRVAKGDTILVIDPERLLTQKRKLELSLKRSRIDRTIAERDLNNASELSKAGAISGKKLQDSELARDLAAISYEQQLLELKDLNDQLGKTVITAPMSGVLTNLLVEEGEIAVSATSGFQSGTSIGTIADISKLEVITSIGEVDYIHLAKGQNAVIRPEAVEGASTRGTIGFISLSAKKRDQEELATFEVRIAIDSLIAGIAPGINVNVEFVILEKKQVLGIPYHFVQTRGPHSYVNAVRGKGDQRRIDEVKVATGATDYRFIEILSGLREGDEVQYRQDVAAEQPGREGRSRGGRRGR